MSRKNSQCRVQPSCDNKNKTLYYNWSSMIIFQSLSLIYGVYDKLFLYISMYFSSFISKMWRIKYSLYRDSFFFFFKIIHSHQDKASTILQSIAVLECLRYSLQKRATRANRPGMLSKSSQQQTTSERHTQVNVNRHLCWVTEDSSAGFHLSQKPASNM